MIEIKDLGVHLPVIDKTDGTIAIVTNWTSNSVELELKAKTDKGIDCKQWYTIKEFNDRFTNAKRI